MRAVYKYGVELKSGHVAELSPPTMKGAQLLKVGEQGSQIVAWALVDTNADVVVRKLNVFGTGHAMPADGSEGPHVDSVQLSNGLVFHFFDAGERQPEEWELG